MASLKFALRLILGAGLIAYLLVEHELTARNVLTNVESLPLAVFSGAVLLYVLGQLLSAYRWAQLSTLAGVPVEFRVAWPVYFTGMFFNLCLPTAIGGDVVRVVGLSRHTGSKSTAFASVFMDRNVGMSALLLIGLAGSLAVPATLEITLSGQRYVAPLWPMFVLLIAGYIATNALLFSDSFCSRGTKLLEGVRLKFLGEKLLKLHRSLAAYRQPLSRYAWQFALSLVYQINLIAAVWLLAGHMNLPVSPWVYFAIVPFQAVASLLPITFSGMGVREGIFCAVIMGLAGAAYKDEALALSLSFFAITVVSSLLGGVVYMLSGMPRPTQAEAAETAATAATPAGSA